MKILPGFKNTVPNANDFFLSTKLKCLPLVMDVSLFSVRSMGAFLLSAGTKGK